MGVPVFSLYDSKYFIHFQNVTCSILKNSNMDWFIYNSNDQLYSKIDELVNKNDNFWKSLKETTRTNFLNGNVCNEELYIENISNLFESCL